MVNVYMSFEQYSARKCRFLPSSWETAASADGSEEFLL